MRKTIKEDMLRAWQKYRYGADSEYDPNDPIQPSDNFEKGFMAGLEVALSNQWVSVEERLPDDRQEVVYMFRWRNPRTGVWHEDGIDACRYDIEYGFRTDNENVTYWMPVPELNPII